MSSIHYGKERREMDEIKARFASIEQTNRLLHSDVQALTASIEALRHLRADVQRVDAESIESRVRVSRQRTALAFVTLMMAVLLPLASALVYWSLITRVDATLFEQRVEGYRSCNLRNSAAEANVRRESELARLYAGKPEGELHRQSAEQLRGGVVDCDMQFADVLARRRGQGD
jgi:hypothetical protein